MSHSHVATTTARSHRVAPLVARLATAGAAVGVAVGLTELAIGASIRLWVGNKYDTVGLGAATAVLSAVALASAIALGNTRRSSPARRLLLTLGLLVPGLICFTTAGRLWIVPGTMLCAAAFATAWELRSFAPQLAADVAARWPDVLVFALGLYIAALGAAAGGLVGLTAIAGALTVMTLAVVRRHVRHAFAVIGVTLATVPLALATWWSVVTPVIALLVVVITATFRIAPHVNESEEARSRRARASVGRSIEPVREPDAHDPRLAQHGKDRRRSVGIGRERRFDQRGLESGGRSVVFHGDVGNGHQRPVPRMANPNRG